MADEEKSKKAGELFKEYVKRGDKQQSKSILSNLAFGFAITLIPILYLIALLFYGAGGFNPCDDEHVDLKTPLFFALPLCGLLGLISGFGILRENMLGVIIILLGVSLLILFVLFLGDNIALVTCSPPELCTMSAGMICSSFYLSSATETLEITLLNGMQKTIVITNLSCSKDPNQFEDVEDVSLGLGKSQKFETSCNDETGNPSEFDYKERYSGKINVQYYFQDEGPEKLRKLSGNIVVKAD